MNDSTEYTPYPWKYTPANAHYEHGHIESDGEIIAKLTASGSAPENNANGILMTAAPHLLHFAREFDEACAFKSRQGEKAVLGITELNRLAALARAVIARATHP